MIYNDDISIKLSVFNNNNNNDKKKKKKPVGFNLIPPVSTKLNFYYLLSRLRPIASRKT